MRLRASSRQYSNPDANSAEAVTESGNAVADSTETDTDPLVADTASANTISDADTDSGWTNEATVLADATGAIRHANARRPGLHPTAILTETNLNANAACRPDATTVLAAAAISHAAEVAALHAGNRGEIADAGKSAERAGYAVSTKPGGSDQATRKYARAAAGPDFHPFEGQREDKTPGIDPAS